MRVTNSMIYDRVITQLNNQQARLAETQEKISTGKNILKPSDSPDQVAALDRLESRVRQTERYLTNINSIKDKLGQQELAANTMNDDLSRVKELLIQGANGTLNAAARDALAIELKEIYNSMISLGNRKDVDGTYLFSGYVQDRAPFSFDLDPLNQDGSEKTFKEYYAGNNEVQVITVDDGYQLEVGMPGNQLFAGFSNQDGNPTSVFAVLKLAIKGLEDNDVAQVSKSIDDVGIALTHVNNRLAAIGSKLNTAETQLGIHQSRMESYEMTISRIADLDYTTAVTELKNQSLALQAGQSSFAQISNLSLFNYIR